MERGRYLEVATSYARKNCRREGREERRGGSGRPRRDAAQGKKGSEGIGRPLGPLAGSTAEGNARNGTSVMPGMKGGGNGGKTHVWDIPHSAQARARPWPRHGTSTDLRRGLRPRVQRSRPKEKKGEEGQDDKDGERAIPRGRHELRPEKLPQGETRGKEMRVRTTRREVRRGRYLEVAMSYARKKNLQETMRD